MASSPLINLDAFNTIYQDLKKQLGERVYSTSVYPDETLGGPNTVDQTAKDMTLKSPYNYAYIKNINVGNNYTSNWYVWEDGRLFADQVNANTSMNTKALTVDNSISAGSIYSNSLNAQSGDTITLNDNVNLASGKTLTSDTLKTNKISSKTASGTISITDNVELSAGKKLTSPNGSITTLAATTLTIGTAGATDGTLTVNGRLKGESIGITSSRKVKENIKPTTINALETLNKVDVVDFNYILDKTKAPKVGFIAEDVEPILSGPEQDRMELANCVGILIKAVQELQEKINKLENK